jgi:hypothetical protein
MNSLVVALYGLAAFVDKTPAAKDVKAGWGAFGIFLGLALAVAFLGWSLIRHLKKADANAEAGLFGKDDSAS